ncbi:hypothetical protein [Azospirillum argentinense]
MSGSAVTAGQSPDEARRLDGRQVRHGFHGFGHGFHGFIEAGPPSKRMRSARDA